MINLVKPTLLVYKVSTVNLGSVDDIIMSLNDLTDIKATYISPKQEIHIQVPNTFSMSDALSLGAYIGQIETMQLI